MIRSNPVLKVCVVALLAGSCGGAPNLPVPAAPEAAVRGFLAAVRTNDLETMSEFWGTNRGLAVGSMDREELVQRLTVMQRYLDHESFEIVTGNETFPAERNQQIVQVQLTRGGCTPVVPFTLVRYRQGWLVFAIDLEAAGNPARRCR